MNLPPLIQNFFRSELFRYLVSGVIAFACDFSVLIAGTEILGYHYMLSNIAAFAVGLLVSYTINIKWVFRHRRYHGRQAREFIYFTLIVFTALAISEGALWLWTEELGLHYIWSKIIATFFVFVFNFIVKKWLLFSPEKD
jgi:putative flippase GtrA